MASPSRANTGPSTGPSRSFIQPQSARDLASAGEVVMRTEEDLQRGNKGSVERSDTVPKFLLTLNQGHMAVVSLSANNQKQPGPVALASEIVESSTHLLCLS